MKKIISLLALLFICFTTNAQKIAHIDFDSLVTQLPESKTVQDVAGKFMDELRKGLTDMQNEFQKKYDAYMSERDKLSELIRQNREEELTMLQQKIQEYSAQAENLYQSKMQELTAPLIEKAKKAVAAAAKKAGYHYVFDLTGNIIYFEPSGDLFNASKKEFETMPAAKIPGAQETKTMPEKKEPNKVNPK